MSNEEIVKALTENTQRSKSNSHRIDELEERSETLHKMATALEVLATKQSGMAEKLEKIDSKVSMLEASPGKRAQAFIGYIIAALCSATVGVIFGFYF